MVLVPALLELAVLLLTLALATLATIIVVALFETLIRALSAVGLGGIVTDWLRSIEQALTSGLGSIERGVDAAIGHSWHAFARMADLVWKDIKEAAHSDWAVIDSLAHTIGRVAHLHAIAHGLERAWRGIEHGVKSLERWAIRMEHRIHKIEHDIAHGIGEDLLPRTKALEREVGKLEGTTIPNLRSLAREAENEAQRALSEVEAIPFPASAKTWAEAVAVALPVLGLEWLRCNSNPFKGNKSACNLWGDLAGLLGLVTTVLIAEDFEQLVREMQAVEGEAIGVAKDLFNLG